VLVTVFIDHHAVGRVLTYRDCIALLEEVFRHEAAGETVVSPRLASNFRSGGMRILFAADHAHGFGATKAYHTIEGVGTRYLVSLIDLGSGALVALIDGRHITDFRTGGASGVVARRMAFDGPVSVGILGSGHQARAQLECLASVCRIARASVFSPTAENRAAFARDMSVRLALAVEAVPTAEAAVRRHDIVVAASKSRSAEPVVRPDWLGGCRLLCAVGNTRPQFAEIDPRCCDAARLVVVDTPHAIDEAGELIQANAAGFLPDAKVTTLAALAAEQAQIPADGMILFKSVGSALQDLALARHCYEVVRNEPEIPVLPDLYCGK
jgi:ornithine cyclodeaminase/alanine dehydrogenase-like protein (mu-crystallin family)